MRPKSLATASTTPIRAPGRDRPPVPLPDCPKVTDPCVAGFYPHCATCNRIEREVVAHVVALIARVYALRESDPVIDRYYAATQRIVDPMDPIAIEAGLLWLTVHERRYSRVSVTDLQRYTLARLYGRPLPPPR